MMTLEEKLKQHQKYLNSLDRSEKLIRKHHLLLWYLIQYQTFPLMGIRVKQQRLSSSLDSGNTNSSTNKLFKTVMKSGLNVTADVVTGSELDLSKEAFKVGLRGMIWLTEFAEDRLTSPEQYYLQAVEQFKSRNYQESFVSISKAIRKNKKYADAFCLRGCIYSEAGEIQLAIQDLNSAIEMDPTCANAYKKRASINYAHENYKKALEDELSLISRRLHDSMSYFRLGMMYAHLKSIDKAIESFNASIQVNPSHVLSYLARGYTILISEKNLNQAVNDFKAVTKIDSNCAEAYLGCAKAHEALGQYNLSIDCYSIIIKYPKLFSGDVRSNAYTGRCLSHFLYALSLARRGMHKKALEQFTRCRKDYQLSNLRNKKFQAEIVKNKCLSYVGLGKKWRALLDAYLGGLNPNDIHGLDFNKFDKILIVIFTIFLLIIGFFCLRTALNSGMILNLFEQWSN